MQYTENRKWTVKFHRFAEKQIKKLPFKVTRALDILVEDLEINGPQPDKYWSHYGKLKGIGSEDRRHCHLSKGRPTYVACWVVLNNQIQIIEVYYVGTHEKAPY